MIKRKVLICISIFFLAVGGNVYAGDSDLTLDTSDSSSAFNVKNSSDATVLRARGDGNVGIGETSPGEKLSVAGTIESTSGGIKFPDGTTQTTAALPLVVSDSDTSWGLTTTFSPVRVFTMDFSEIPGTQIRLMFRGFLNQGEAGATLAEYRLAINESFPPSPVEILGSTVSTSNTTNAVFLDTGWIDYTSMKPAGLAGVVVQARVNASDTSFTDLASIGGATIWFK